MAKDVGGDSRCSWSGPLKPISVLRALTLDTELFSCGVPKSVLQSHLHQTSATGTDSISPN